MTRSRLPRTPAIARKSSARGAVGRTQDGPTGNLLECVETNDRSHHIVFGLRFTLAPSDKVTLPGFTAIKSKVLAKLDRSYKDLLLRAGSEIRRLTKMKMANLICCAHVLEDSEAEFTYFVGLVVREDLIPTGSLDSLVKAGESVSLRALNAVHRTQCLESDSKDQGTDQLVGADSIDAAMRSVLARGVDHKLLLQLHSGDSLTQGQRVEIAARAAASLGPAIPGPEEPIEVFVVAVTSLASVQLKLVQGGRTIHAKFSGGIAATLRLKFLAMGPPVVVKVQFTTQHREVTLVEVTQCALLEILWLDHRWFGDGILDLMEAQAEYLRTLKKPEEIPQDASSTVVLSE
jgi:hypothetical protein